MSVISRHMLGASAVLFVSLQAWAVPAAPIDVTLTQPDGTPIVARPRGDEYVSWLETTDGYTIVQSGTTWYYATVNANNTIVPTNIAVGQAGKSSLSGLRPHMHPSVDPRHYEKRFPRKLAAKGTGAKGLSVTQPVLTIMVSFTDIGFTYSEASFQALMYSASNSVKSFYADTSYNGFTIAPATESYGTANDGLVNVSLGYAHPNFGSTYGAARNQLVADAFAAADSYINYASYDTNGNGSISAQELSIILVIAGYENSYGGSSSLTPRIWAHMSGISNQLLDGVNLSPFAMFGERHATSVGNSHQATIGIMCHELGHLMLGLPDLYDRDLTSEGVGTWCLMAYGSWNVTGTWIGDSPSLLSAWCKAITGISDPVDISTTSSGVSILRASDNDSIKRLWIDPYKNEDYGSQYFLVENRQMSGFDAGLPGSGLAIWHIDSSVSTQNDNESHKLVDLEEADGLTSMDTGANQGDAGDPYPGTSANTAFNDGSTPNSRDYSGAPTNIGVTGISTASLPTITADMTPGNIVPGDSLGYDEYGVTGQRVGYASAIVWTAISFTNTTGMDRIDGFDIYCSKACTIDFYLYTSIAGGNLSGLLHSQTEFAATAGFNRLLLTTPQSFPAASTRVMVLKINMPTESYPANYDGTGTFSGNCYFDDNGSGTFFLLNAYGDLNQRLLLSSTNTPSATTITPTTSSPTNSDTVSFSVTFSESVQNFDALGDLVVNTTGSVSYSGASITGGPQVYSASITGVDGGGTMSLAVSTGSDVEDLGGTPLGSSVTSSAVTIDNTAPTVSLSSAAQNPTTGAITVNVTLSQSSTDFTSGDVTPTNASVSGFSGSGTSYSFMLTPGGQGAFSAVVNASTFTDAAGNNNTASNTLNYTFDSVAPTISLSSAAPDPTGAAITVDVSLSESSSNFVSGDVSLSNATISNFSGSGDTYNFTLTPVAPGLFSAQVNAGAFFDQAGNANTASNVLSRTYAPSEVYVDFDFSGTELGTLAQPYNTLAEGVAAVAVSGTVKLTGDTNETARVTKAVRIEATSGPARVGSTAKIMVSNFTDSDGDGLPDWWELQYGLNPKDSSGDDGAAGDPDIDGYSNLDEYGSGTDPMLNGAKALPTVNGPVLMATLLLIVFAAIGLTGSQRRNKDRCR